MMYQAEDFAERYGSNALADSPPISRMLAAGVPVRWFDTTEGVGVSGLRTPYGALTYRLRKVGRDYRLDFAGEAAPPGGFVLRWPEAEARPASVRIDGRAAAWTGDALAIPAGSKRVVLR